MMPDPKEARAVWQPGLSGSQDSPAQSPDKRWETEEAGDDPALRSRCPGRCLFTSREPAGSYPPERALRQATPGRPQHLGSLCLRLRHRLLCG